VIAFESILIVASAVGTLVVLVALVARGPQIGWDFSGQAVVALYVRIASLAGTVVFALGLAELFRAWLITALPETQGAVTSTLPMAQVVRGATLLIAGGVFWTIHFFLPRPAVRGSSGLYLAFLAVGAAASGLATIGTLPLGIAEEVERLFGVTASSRSDGLLGGGLAGLAVWLGHLWQLRAHLGRGRIVRARRIYPGGWPPTAPAVVGAPLIRPPDTRSAGAVAVPPHDADG
jgi:hypothetical protein